MHHHSLQAILLILEYLTKTAQILHNSYQIHLIWVCVTFFCSNDLRKRYKKLVLMAHRRYGRIGKSSKGPTDNQIPEMFRVFNPVE